MKSFDFSSFLFWFSRRVYTGAFNVFPPGITHRMTYRLGYYNCLRDLRNSYEDQKRRGFDYDR